MSSSALISFASLKPSLLFVATAILTTIALHFPHRLHRFFLLPTWFLTAWSLASVDGDATSGGPIGLDSYTAITCIIYMLILLRILLAEKHSLLDKAEETGNLAQSRNSVVSPSRTSISEACRIWNNPRQLSFRRPVPGSVPWPELLRFTLLRVAKAGIIILIDRVLVQKIRASLTATCTVFDFTPDQEPILRRLLEMDEDDPVSQHQLLLRAFMSVSWVWANVLILESYHAVLSVLFVAVLRFDNPEDWPPLFGNLAEAWTKAIVAFGIFFLSGLAHAVAAWKVGQGEAYRDLLFFCANFIVVGVEILGSGLVRSMVRKTRYATLLRDRRLEIVQKTLGFAWVFAWFFWATPRWMYSKTLRWSLKQALLQSRT
ncbi:hypothetical protein GGR54DRAFT_654280 [Hypoxylon sp. NC1633]|nr:hypothetical protein GGR54DRAFT_654280 [Hypoxylon sp. NC1633]